MRTTDGLPTDYTFTGQKLDASSGLLYYGARYYDAAMGRFVQPDTTVTDPYNPQDLNRYTYVRNNPLNHVDPTGHDCVGLQCPPYAPAPPAANPLNASPASTPVSSNGGLPNATSQAVPAPAAISPAIIAPPDFNNLLPDGNPPPPGVEGLPSDGWQYDDKWPDLGPGYRNRDDPRQRVYRPDEGYTSKKGTEGEDPHWHEREPGDKGRGNVYPPNPEWGRKGQRDHPGAYNPRTGNYESRGEDQPGWSIGPETIAVPVAPVVTYVVIKAAKALLCSPTGPAGELVCLMTPP